MPLRNVRLKLLYDQHTPLLLTDSTYLMKSLVTSEKDRIRCILTEYFLANDDTGSKNNYQVPNFILNDDLYYNEKTEQIFYEW